MLSRYFSFITVMGVAPVAMFVTMGMSFPAYANANVLLDTNGNPLPNDFGALIELLDSASAEQKRKLLGTSAVSAPRSVTPEPASATKSTPAASAEAVEPEVTEKQKNPAFYNPELAKRLYDALDVGDAARSKWLLDSGAGNKYVTEKGDTSLRLAIRKRWASVVRVLLERDPDLTQMDTGKVSLLHEASARGAYDIAKMLIDAGLDPHAKTAKNWTNLHLAARFGHADMVRYYLQIGLDPNARNSEGNTAHWLAMHLRHYQAGAYLAPHTSATSHQSFGDEKSKKGSSKRSRRSTQKSKPARGFSPAELEMLRSIQ
ncbi:ankyrin repeat domain-containing protein [Leucothrix mucor]|uniref:ankyrin repeat domain-containing protein n=1 Tax=Leucothrix mucor TaxID=45248 RepID=UPI0003B77217|nr:ankyrin repeat domain-containing protein [Leucothrix mucor]